MLGRALGLGNGHSCLSALPTFSAPPGLCEGREDAWAPLQDSHGTQPDVWAGGSEPDFLTPTKPPPAGHHLSHCRLELWAHVEFFRLLPPLPTHTVFTQ